MKRSALSLILLILLFAAVALCQSSSSDPYKATLDRLESLTRQSEAEWRFHVERSSSGRPGVSDSDWGTWTVKNVSGPGGQNANEEHWKGTRVFRRWIQIPEKINGYSTQGSRVSDSIYVRQPGQPDDHRVLQRGGSLPRRRRQYSSGAVDRECTAGQKFLVAARVVAGDDGASRSSSTARSQSNRHIRGLILRCCGWKFSRLARSSRLTRMESGTRAATG